MVEGRAPASPEDFDWRRFQQEYRDYIDLAKLAQLLPAGEQRVERGCTQLRRQQRLCHARLLRVRLEQETVRRIVAEAVQPGASCEL